MDRKKRKLLGKEQLNEMGYRKKQVDGHKNNISNKRREGRMCTKRGKRSKKKRRNRRRASGREEKPSNT